MRIVHSPALEHNLLNDLADQPVSVYLPEAYGKEEQRRFPVLYFLHGYGNTAPRGQRIEERMLPWISKQIAP